MPIVFKTQVAAKIEGTEGAAETLAAADAFLAENAKFKSTIGVSQRNSYSASLSPFAAIPGQRSAQIEFDVEVKGSGTAGTAPVLGKLLKACGFGETVAAGTSVTYKPASSGISSMTLALYMDGVIKKIWGARGDVSLKLENGKPAYLHFVFTGADFSVADGALLANVTYEATTPPPFMNATFTIDSYAALIASMNISMGNTVALRPDVNALSGHKSAVITKRDPKLTYDPELPTVAAYDFYGKLRSGAQGALTLALAGGAGNICTITAPKVQSVDISGADRESFQTLGVDCQLNRNTGDDELSIAFT
ncbi:MAG TPA: phage tail tube protein [Acidobacteriota bacterium]|nr:phage tail tube protein [Acidobacteriota bacterium]